MAKYTKSERDQMFLPYWAWQALAPTRPAPLTREQEVAKWADRQARSAKFRAEVAEAKALRDAEADAPSDPTKEDQS